ncbi:TolC family protein [Chitinophaga filiformis]|uniref:TolC family protein n=1 Tax=Chitinophaga filiformis TaxID=104663 RepID=UPI001F31D7B1|nr:TolC family protein [Chitinophaga filiformis]MCF6406413.1 TolC family protein [Chitinophaga filiformis]
MLRIYQRLYTAILLSIGLLSGVHGQSQYNLSLNESIRLALANNRTLKVDSISLSVSREETQTVRSGLLPSVDFDANVNHYFQKPLFFGFETSPVPASDKIGYGRFGGKDQASFSLTAAVPLYKPATKAGVEKSRLLEKQSVLQYKATASDIVAQVKQVYLRMLVLAKRLQLQEESIERNVRALEDARSLLAQGKALRVDTLRAYTSWKNLEPDLLRLHYYIEVSRQELRVITGLDSVEDLHLTDTLAFDEHELIPSEREIFNVALNNRPALKLLALRQTTARKDLEIARKEKLPAVNAIGNYQLLTQASGFKYHDAHWPSVSFVGIQTRIPLFAGHLHRSKINIAKLQERQSLLQYEEAVEKLHTQTQEIAAALNETRQRIQTQENVVSTAETSYVLTKYRYERGAATRLELTDAELALTTAQSNYLEAVFNYLSARINMNRITGSIE